MEKQVIPYKSGTTPTRPLAAKKRGTMSLLRAAIFMVRRPSKGNKTPIQCDVMAQSAGQNGLLNNLLGAVRPLHQLEHQPKSSSTPEPVSLPYKEIYLPPPSPCGSEDWFSSDGMSRYASAEDLHSLDTTGGDDEDDGADGIKDGAPHAIDLQAEEFIARFYEQMRLQRTNSFANEVI